MSNRADMLQGGEYRPYLGNLAGRATVTCCGTHRRAHGWTSPAEASLIFDGEVSTGASDDFQRAVRWLTEMVTRYGMVETLRARTYARPPQPFLTGTMADRIQASEATKREIDIAVRDIVARAFDRATEVLRARRADQRGARLLLAQETVTADQFPAISSAGTQLKPPAEFAARSSGSIRAERTVEPARFRI